MLSGMVGAALRASHIGWYLRMVAPPIREEKEGGGRGELLEKRPALILGLLLVHI